ncbi:hypothetical protein ACVW0Y_002343 [Pseudomonas sp. TE3786]
MRNPPLFLHQLCSACAAFGAAFCGAPLEVFDER